MLKEKIKNL